MESELFLQNNPLATLEVKTSNWGAIWMSRHPLYTSTTSTLCKFLNKNQMKLQVATKTIFLTDPDSNLAKRIAFCRNVANFIDEKFESIWFSDETMAKSRPN